MLMTPQNLIKNSRIYMGLPNIFLNALNILSKLYVLRFQVIVRGASTSFILSRVLATIFRMGLQHVTSWANLNFVLKTITAAMNWQLKGMSRFSLKKVVRRVIGKVA